MNLTDTHTHIYYLDDEKELDQSVKLCVDNDVNRLFLACIDANSVEAIKTVCAKYPTLCFPMLGLHPCEVKQDYEFQLQLLKEAFNNVNPFAIGEIGMDLYWDKTFKAEQMEAFNAQIIWAKEKQLPINIHCREAFDEVFEILQSYKGENLRGILHCFTGNLAQAKQAIDLGFYLGIGGVLTYKNAGLDKVVAELSLQNLVLETDAPYLAPVPFRGKTNESAYVRHIADKMADIFEIGIEEVAEITTQNSKKVFGV